MERKESDVTDWMGLEWIGRNGQDWIGWDRNGREWNGEDVTEVSVESFDN